MTLLTFRVEKRCYGIDVVSVEEVFPLPEIIPLAPVEDGCCGFVNLRGQLIRVLDLRLRLAGVSVPHQLSDSIVVVHFGKVRFAWIVDQVCDVFVVNAADDLAEDEPLLQAHQDLGVIKSVVQGQETVILVLDIEGVVGAFLGQKTGSHG